MANIERRKNGYRIVCSAGYDKGKQIKRYKTWNPPEGMSKKAAEKEVQRLAVIFEEQVKNSGYISGSIKLSDFIELWFKEFAEKQLKPKTVFWYRTLVPRINAGLGHLPVEKIQAHHLLKFYDNLGETGIRANSKYKATADIRSLLKCKEMTIREFSELSSVSEWSLNKVMKGDNVSMNTAMKVSEALGEKLSSLFAPLPENTKPLSGTSVQQYHKALSAILNRAVKWRVITVNPCTLVDAPKADSKKKKYLDEKEAVRMLTLLDEEDILHRTMITLLLLSGMRREELLALSWDDVDFESRTITIDKALVYIPGQGTSIESTKNRSSERTVTVSPLVLNLLKQWKIEQKKERLNAGDHWVNSGRIFTGWDGNNINPDALSRWFRKFAQKNGFDVNLHSLRHTSATILISGGADIRTVSHRLGHSQTSTTLNIYSHVLKSADEAAAETLDVMLKIKKISV